MPLNVFQDPQQAAGWILSVIFAVISILATVLRFAATRRAGRCIGWEDWYALLALVFILPYIAYVLYLTSTVNGRTVLAFVKQQPDTFHELLKIGNVMNGLYGIQQTFAKYSLLALYYRLFWINRSFTITMWSVAAIQGCWGLVVLLVHIFACNPIAKVWIPALPGSCINVNLFFSIYEPINSAIDFVMAGMAIWVVRALQIKRKTQWHLSVLFMIGAFSGIIGLIKVADAQNAAQSTYLSVIWNVVQMGTSIICCCAPTYQSIFPKMTFLSSMRSWLSHTLIPRYTSSGYDKKRSEGIGGASSGSSEIYQGQPRGMTRLSNWVPLQGSSERSFAWANVEAEHGLGETHASNTIAMKTVIHQSADSLRQQ